jgi:hypothetical protein
VEQDYRQIAPSVAFASREEVYQQDFVLVLRYPDDGDIRQMRPGTCLISMLVFTSRKDTGQDPAIVSMITGKAM